MDEEEMIQGLEEAGYSEKEIDKLIEEGLTEEQYEELLMEKEEQVSVSNGRVKFKSVNHSERAVKFGRLSDGDITKYVNVALEYFGNRCALSGEEFVSFGKVENLLAKSNLSAEHVVALCQGGDDIVPNLVPTVLQYNLRKNGYYILDYWKKQKDINGKTLYSPYRLLKLVNYMMKSIEARELDVRKYKKTILTPNEIDEYLKQIEEQDKKETDNNQRKIYSDTITTTTMDEDNKKILTEVPLIEGNIPTQKEQQKHLKENEEINTRMMDIFLIDAIREIKENEELSQVVLQNKNGEKLALTDKLDLLLEKTIGIIPFEVQVRNKILETIEEIGIKENKYSVANALLINTDILKIAKQEGIEEEQVDKYIEKILEEKTNQLKEILTEEQIKKVITNNPEVLYDNNYIERIKFWKEKREQSLGDLLQEYKATDKFIDVIIILKEEGVDLSKIKVGSSKISDLIKDKENAKKIIQRLQEISEEIDEKWPIGQRLSTQKSKTNIEQFIKEIKKSGIELKEEEIKVILEKETNEEKSQRITEEFVQVLVVLKEEGMDLSKIQQKDKIQQLIENQENAKKIIQRLQEISEEIDEKWPIGKRLNSQKSKRTIEKFKEEIVKSGLDLLLSEAEMKKLTEVRTKETKLIDIQQATQDVSTQGCDEKQIFMKQLEKQIEEQEKVS